jgi:protein SCO1/2
MIRNKFGSLHAAQPVAKRSDLFADVRVENQFGDAFRFRTDLIQNRRVVLSSMYTVCRGSCPTTNETLQRLRGPLTKLFGKRVTLLSFTLDPVTDTVAALREYSDLYGASDRAQGDQCDWYFLTGTAESIETLRKSLGFFDLDQRIDSDLTRHASLYLIGNDEANRWGTSPSNLRDGLVFETFRRLLGNTSRERFGIDIRG